MEHVNIIYNLICFESWDNNSVRKRFLHWNDSVYFDFINARAVKLDFMYSSVHKQCIALLLGTTQICTTNLFFIAV